MAAEFSVPVIETIKNLKELERLKRIRKNTIITTYRGSWCRYCRGYLKALDAELSKFSWAEIALIGVSSDSVTACRELKHRLELKFDLVEDKKLIFAEQFGVKMGQRSSGQYLQPSVLVFCDGEETFRWIQSPQLKNLRGAIDRLPPSEVFNKVPLEK